MPYIGRKKQSHGTLPEFPQLWERFAKSLNSVVYVEQNLFPVGRLPPVMDQNFLHEKRYRIWDLNKMPLGHRISRCRTDLNLPGRGQKQFKVSCVLESLYFDENAKLPKCSWKCEAAEQVCSAARARPSRIVPQLQVTCVRRRRNVHRRRREPDHREIQHHCYVELRRGVQHAKLLRVERWCALPRHGLRWALRLQHGTLVHWCDWQSRFALPRCHGHNCCDWPRRRHRRDSYRLHH